MVRCLALLSVAVLAVVMAVPAAASVQTRPTATADGWIVVFKDSVGSVGYASDELQHREGFRTEFRYRHALKGFAAGLSATQLAALRRDPRVAYVAPNRIVRADAAVASGEQIPPGIQRLRAATPNPNGSARGASSVGVAVIDTGIDLGHPELNAVDGTNCITPGTPAQDDQGHGTHVSGTIAARNDTFGGVVGIAPGTTVYAVKVLDSSGVGSSAEVICGIDWATANADARNIRVANMSLGGTGAPLKACPAAGTVPNTGDPEHDAFCRSTAAGVAYAVAAGNSGYDFDYAPAPSAPAAYPEAVTVTAMSDTDGTPGAGGAAPSCRTGEADDRYASFSNYAATAGGQAHTLAAPGVCVRSTYLRGVAADPYAVLSGTSMATPHVAGALALCKGEVGSTAPPPCGLTETSPATLIPKITSTEPTYGFAGDPSRPVSGQYYGYLALAGSPPPVP